MTNPRIEAVAFRIWQHCEPIGWNATLDEIAEAIEVRIGLVRYVVSRKGWSNRVRTGDHDYSGCYPPQMRQAHLEIAFDVVSGRIGTLSDA